MIFSHVLYQLSYLGTGERKQSERTQDFSTWPRVMAATDGHPASAIVSSSSSRRINEGQHEPEDADCVEHAPGIIGAADPRA